MKNDILALARAMEPRLVKFMQDIIAIKSLSSQEGKVAKRIAAEMKALGYDQVRTDKMGNVIGRIGKGPVQIAIDGHIDTVDVGDLAAWKTDPFDPVIKKGVLYGRGTSDMKGGVAAAVYSGALLKKAGLMPKNVTLLVTGTVQEEDCDGLCWQYLVREEKIRPNVVVITEPTSLRIYRGHRGRMELEVETTGISCHGSAPERGVNAVYKMAPIIADIEKLNERLKPRKPLGKGTVTISHIRSRSPSLCAVADGCVIHLDRRLTIGETEDVVVRQIKALPSVKKAKAIVRVLDYDTPSYTGLSYPTKKYFPTWEMPESTREVKKAREAFEAVFADIPVVGHWTFSTNGIATAGMHDIPTIGFGPGHEHFAHAPNECVEIEHLTRACAFYAGFVLAYAAK
ncbi:MAG TPA: YgeY family selenium metabolism-linked hydrolase [Kiritimatiellia bacterium]|nr:YgeY family selenium metabolism-linked hydrolase [Kiritimatiellia bacterium]HMP35675.1 YgeY family selenium metabolism-linked hydrolase [Kiritimatiellia bacterium]